LTRYTGALTWDAAQPDGQPRRSLDGARAERAFGFRAHTPLDDGLRRTIDWFERTRIVAHAAAR
jgi:GDP-L-fucose synthase